MSRYLTLPNRTEPLLYFDQFSWTTQIYHAEIMRFQIEAFRRSISLPENNLGALVWQLNAPWTTLALNSIEYTGRWKVLQYTTQQVFRRVVSSVWFEPSNETMQIWVASDAWEPVAGVLKATWMTWSGEILNSTSYPFQLDALDSRIVSLREGWASILPSNQRSNDTVLLMSLEAATSSGTRHASENFWVPNYLSNSTLVDPGLQLAKTAAKTWTVTARKGVAAYVWLTEPSGVVGFWDQNAVFMAKGESRDFTFTVQEDHSDGGWVDGVRVRSIWDNYEI
jgi:beta-mannosidase